MLFVIGVVCFVLAICIIIYNTPKNASVMDTILEKGDQYADLMVISKSNEKIEKVDLVDPPVVIGDKYDGEIECPKSLGCSSGGKNERRCRAILKKIFNKDFPTVRPIWLKNPHTKRCLEIDMYCHELLLGLEYDGSQHHNMTKFHKTHKELIYQIKKDQYKNMICKKLGITLIRVPYWINPAQFESYIKGKLKYAGKLPASHDDPSIKPIP